MLRSTSSAARFIHSTRGFAHSFVARHSPPQLPYCVQRNSRGSIPVYTDIRNAGTRYLVLIRNVQGNVNVRPTLPPPLSSRVFVIGNNTREDNTAPPFVHPRTIPLHVSHMTTGRVFESLSS